MVYTLKNSISPGIRVVGRSPVQLKSGLGYSQGGPRTAQPCGPSDGPTSVVEAPLGQCSVRIASQTPLLIGLRTRLWRTSRASGRKQGQADEVGDACLPRFVCPIKLGSEALRKPEYVPQVLTPASGNLLKWWLADIHGCMAIADPRFATEATQATVL